MNYFIFIACATFSLAAQEGFNQFSMQVDAYFAQSAAQQTDEPVPPYTQSKIPQRLQPIFFGYALQALMPTVAKNACLTDKISPFCLGQVID
jgi:hypothetical protein